MLRILIADAHDVVRRGVRGQLSQRTDWRVCAEARNGRDAVDLARRVKPDVAVLDLSMPELNGIEATRQIRRELPGTEVLLFSMHNQEQLIRSALDAGARAFVLKSDQTYHLTKAVEALSHHRSYFSETVLQQMHFQCDTRVYQQQNGVTLTGRENEVLQMLTEGRSNREVAHTLQISVKTVETHRASVMRKLDINSIVELVHYAIRNRIVEA